MSFAIWSSLGRREHAMDRASKILNIAIEIGERCELHICSLCVVKGRHSNHCWRWHLQPAAVTPSKRLMPENNRECMPSKTVVSDSASCWLFVSSISNMQNSRRLLFTTHPSGTN